METHWEEFLKETSLLQEVIDKMNPILDELSLDLRESRLSKETESSDSTEILEISNKLAQVSSMNSPDEIYSNIEIRLEKIKDVLLSMHELKINFQKEKLVNIIRCILIS